MEPLITPALLASTGIVVADDQLDAYLDLMNERLSENIGEAVASTLDEDKLDELATLQESGSDESVNKWLQANVPDLDSIIQQELDILLGDAAENSSGINALED